MDFAAIVKLWAKEGRQMGTTKEGIKMNLCRSFMRRQLAAKPDKFFYTN
jgi:hypothetical protein